MRDKVTTMIASLNWRPSRTARMREMYRNLTKRLELSYRWKVALIAAAFDTTAEDVEEKLGELKGENRYT